MGCDLAVCFVERSLTPEQIAGAEAVTRSGASRAYLILGRARRASGGRSFFAAWSDQRIDLVALCAELSSKGRICVSWKSEHGGVAGYMAFEAGNETANESDSGEDYLYLPSNGLERILGVDLGLTDRARLSFPDMLLDDTVACFEIGPGGGTLALKPVDTVTKLLEEELDVEPVLPIDIW